MAGMERREILERMQDAKESMRRAADTLAKFEPALRSGIFTQDSWHYTPEAAKVRKLFALSFRDRQLYRHCVRLNIREQMCDLFCRSIYTVARIRPEA